MGQDADTADGGVPSKRQKLKDTAEGAGNGEEGNSDTDSNNNNAVEENKEAEDQDTDGSSTPLASSGSEEHDDEEEDAAAVLGQEHEPQQNPAVNAPQEAVPPAPLGINPDPAPAHQHHEPLQVDGGNWNSDNQERTPPPADSPEAGLDSPTPRGLLRSRNSLRFEDE